MSEWISVAEACRRAPSPRGKQLHQATIYRWVRSGKVRACKRNGFLFILAEDLDALMVPYEPPAAQPRQPTVTERQRQAHQDAVMAFLKERGLV